jgi:four helix bundle protein
MTERDLIDRTKKFALRIIKLVRALPRTIEGRSIASQLMRSGTSVAANYRAACRARSKAEFISKLGTVEEEAAMMASSKKNASRSMRQSQFENRNLKIS